MNRREVLTVIGLSAASLATLRGVVAQPLATAPTWALEDLYANDAVWTASADSLNGRVAELEGLVDGIGASPQRLYETLHAISQARRESLRLATYAKLAAYADLRDAEAQKRNARAEALLGLLETATVGLNPAVRDLGRQRVDIYLAANPSLAPFRHALDDMLRLAPHALPTTEAGILSSSAALFDGPQATYNQLLGSDMPHPTVVLSTGEQVLLDDSGYVRARSLPNRADRKRVFDRFWTSYNAYRNTLGAILSTQVAGDNMLARLQRYPSALDAALSMTNILDGDSASGGQVC